MRNRIILAAAITITAAGLGACTTEEPPSPPPTPAVRVENPRAGVAIAALSDFVVADNTGASIELIPVGEGVEGTASVVAGEAETGGINLVAAVKQHEEDIRARPDGDYKGQGEYMSPLGTTFASRGRYSEDGSTIEERVVLMVHPWGDRTLQVIYRYPAGEDTQDRLNALMSGVVGELEGLPVPGVEDTAGAETGEP